jgi:hypothetical protein
MTRSGRAILVAGLLLLEGVGNPAGVRAQNPSPPPAPQGSEQDVQTLRERAAAFWAARVAGDAQGQWELLEPRGKGRVTAQEYGVVPEGGRYLAYQVEDATVKGLFATVRVRMLVQVILPKSETRRPTPIQAALVEDGWVRIGGVWYRRLDANAGQPVEARMP